VLSADEKSVTKDPGNLWNFVVAKLAAMRVDACTEQVKEILLRDTVCGERYANCLGLGLVDVQDMVPNDSLTACRQNGQSVTKEDWLITGKVGSIVQGVMLDVDNRMLEICQELATEAFGQLCTGDKSTGIDEMTCDLPFQDDFGTTTLAKTENQTARTAEITGLIDFSKISYTSGSTAAGATETSDVTNNYPTISTSVSGTVETGVFAKFKSQLEMVTEQFRTLDPRVSFCTEGRDLSQVKSRTDGQTTGDRTKTEARFPRMLDPYITLILQAGVSHASVNYDKKLAGMVEELEKSKALKPGPGGIIDANICWVPAGAY